MKAVKKYNEGGVGPGKKKKRKAAKGKALSDYEKQRAIKVAEKEAYVAERDERIAGQRADFYSDRPTRGVNRKADKKNQKKADKLRDKQIAASKIAQSKKESLKGVYDSQGIDRSKRTTVQRKDKKGKGIVNAGGSLNMTSAKNPYSRR